MSCWQKSNNSRIDSEQVSKISRQQRLRLHTHTRKHAHTSTHTIFSIMNTSAQSNIRTHTLEHTHTLYQVTTLRGTLEQVQKSLEAEIVDLRALIERLKRELAAARAEQALAYMCTHTHTHTCTPGPKC
jgi:hypothetical protein